MSEKADKEFRLSAGERRMSAWTNLEKHLHARLASLRAQNDNDLDETKTAKLRGRIAEVINLLALGASPDPTEAADEEQGE
jgi:hypothetical protein